MLVSLHIENIAVIRKLTVDLDEGFTVLTGETGAGKSILIDSLALLCGARSDRELIRTGEDYALVEGCFACSAGDIPQDFTPDEDGLVVVTRRITSDGRSTARVNGRTVPLQKLKELTGGLISIHGQQDTQMLRDRDAMREFLDEYSHTGEEKRSYQEAYSTLLELRSKQKKLDRDEDERRERADFLAYRIAELEAADLKEGEEEELRAERTRLRNLENINRACLGAYSALYDNGESPAAVELLGMAASQLEEAGKFVPELADLANKLHGMKCDAEDAAESAHRAVDEESDGSSLERIEERLLRLAELRRKYGDVSNAMQELEKMRSELDELQHADETAELLMHRLKAQESEVERHAKALRAKREAGALSLAEGAARELAELDMPKTTLSVRVEPQQPGPEGADSVAFFVSANLGEAERPIEKVASGGELSRIMLALRTASAGSGRTPTMIFDEIDTGISGKTSRRIGAKLKKLSQASVAQVLCVTHSAQVASLADHHLLISKSSESGRTVTTVERLDTQARVEELARIIGGMTVTDAARNAARELMDNG